MWFLGQIEHSAYVDDCEGLFSEEIDQFYGVEKEGDIANSDESSSSVSSSEDGDMSEADGSVSEESEGGGIDDEEDDREKSDGSMDGGGDIGWENHIGHILENQRHNIYHRPAPIPHHADPFNNSQKRQAFLASLEIMCSQGIVPHEYELGQEELVGNRYPSVEIIPMQHRKELHISLPSAVWQPRAIVWAQAHHVLSQI
ncbi:hypothetical protein L208DRAFT_1382973 [Tricholoma matsutake]|nr:hypothetical protein L208DRAFT_1382973 [Tricholoma matsutake 945]